ncbi:hypothetical protein EDD31_0521 [Bogoriella caseilytica]|uniref:Uncharacterized protein n=2 Tax=Bogoriella caseilytica TaxID=56055 RepID=A0A3N2BA71_9MICO|nr:hypothetical protein EDD31_0521 [Bogoriella caseilytica]
MPARLRWLPVVAPVLGMLTMAVLLVHGFAISDELPVPSVVVTIMPAFVLALMVGNPPREHPRRWVLQASPPAAMGLVVATTLFGLTLVDSPAWWIGGAVVSTVPFLVVALASPTPKT